MREHTEAKAKTSPRSFTLTDEQHARMREKAQREGITASALLRRWIAVNTADLDGAGHVIQPVHLTPYGGNPDPSSRAAWVRLGKCNPMVLAFDGEACLLCWPNGTPEARRDGRGNIVSWTLDEVGE
jgi:hypothetical protein